MKQKLIERLNAFFRKHEMLGIPATAEQIEQAEKELNVKFSSDYIDFIKNFGRAWAGIEIFAFEGNETVVGYTQSLRDVHAVTSENYAIADDGQVLICSLSDIFYLFIINLFNINVSQYYDIRIKGHFINFFFISVSLNNISKKV